MRSFTVAFILATLCLAFRPLSVSAQASTQTLRQQIVVINRSLPQLKKVKKDVTGTDEGGYLLAWRNEKSIVKIVLWLGFSIHNQEISYYFHQGRLIAVQEQHQYFVWDEAKEVLDRTRLGERKTATYYFQNRKLLKYAGAGKGRTPDAILGDAVDALRMAVAPQKQLSIHDY